MDMTAQRVRDGVRRLLTAPKDLERWDEDIGDPGKKNASVEHRRLYSEYLTNLNKVVSDARLLWEYETRVDPVNSENQAQAIREHWMTFPAGPASYPFVVALIRRYWLACDKINREVPKQRAVAPEHFILGWLVGDSEDEAIEMLAGMPYWPIGLDCDGNWV